ncbi:MAG: extracellular solute-binding protein [Chitinivibrionales bacterium]|nr:extracellular solute-binding protein [Chitinivibrionales bacterium]
MMPTQQRFFKDDIIARFEKENGCKINIATFNNEWDIERLLKLESGKKNPEIGVVKTPFEMVHVLASKGYMKPLSEIVDSAQVVMDMAEYHQLASALGYVDNVAYYLPRKLETRVLFYRKSMVADAVAKFTKHKDRINKELKGVNGYGLPKGYQLKSDPAQWDFYDLYVVGSIWANEEYNGVKMPRIAHRGARYGGTALDLVDRALQLGAGKDDILKMSTDRVADMFVWEQIFIKKNLYAPNMWQDPWQGSNLYDGIKDGKVFLTYLQQIDCFLVHGWPDDPGMPSYLPQANDMGLCVVPQAVSPALSAAGAYEYSGTRAISTGGWWWGIPKTSPNAKLAYQLIRYLTSRENQAKECSKFGMIPVRKDILLKLPQVFDQGWVGDIFSTSIAQMNVNELTTVPLVKQYARVGQNYVEAWYKLCIESTDATFTTAGMKAKLAPKFVDEEKKILGDDYPK